MKRLFIILILGILAVMPMYKTFAEPLVEPLFLEMRDANPIELPEGTFIGVESAQEISTQYCQEGYKVRFISTNDYYVDDTNVVPSNTAFLGYVEDVHDPIVGTNASFKVKITKMILPDDYEIPVEAYIYSSNNNIIGGELTPPAAWRKMPHYQSKIGDKTTLQIRPARERQKGTHAIILAGEDRLVVFTKPLTIIHTISD